MTENTSSSEPPELPATPGKPVRSRVRKAGHHGVRALALLALVPLVLLMICVVLVIDRDIAAPTWVKARIETRAAEMLGGGALTFAGLSVNLGRDLHPRVTLSDATLQDAAGQNIARIPFIRGLFSPRGLVLQGDALMQDLRITGAQINLRRAADGAVALSFQTGGAEVQEAGTLLDLLDQSDQVFDIPALAALETIRVDGAVVNYQDARAGRAWTVDGGTLKLDVRDGMTALTGTFAVLSGGDGITTLDLSYSSPQGNAAADFDITIRDARAADIAAQSPALNWLADVDAPISASLRSARRADGTLAPLHANLSLGAGALQPNAATDPVAFDSAETNFTYDPAGDMITFDTITVAGDYGTVQAEGQALLGDIADGLPQSLVGQLRFTDTVINPAEMLPEPVIIPQAQVDLRLNLQPFSLDIGQFYAQLPGFDLHGAGAVLATDQGWDISATAGIDAADHEAMMALWPQEIMPPVHWFFTELVHEGQYQDFRVSLRKPIDAPLQVAGSFGFEDVSMSFLPPMPPIMGGKGTGVFTGDDFGVQVEAGTVTPAQGGVLDIAGSSMTIPDMRAPYRPGTYDLRISGPTEAALSLLNEPPLRYMDKARLPVDVAGGTAEVQMYLRHPMRRDMTGDDIDFRADAVLRDVASTQLIKGRRLRSERLSLFMDKDRLEIAGAAVVDGVPLDGTWVQRFKGEGGRLQATVGLSPQALDTFDIVLPPGSVAGRGTGTLELTVKPNAAPAYALTSDLRGLRVAIPAVGWAKPPGVAGRLSVVGRLGDRPQVDDLRISGGGLDVAGDVSFRADGSLERARLRQVQISNWLNAPITLRGRGPGQPLGVEIGGGAIDLRRAQFGSGGAGASGPIQIALDRLVITEGITLNRFAGEFTSSGGFAGAFSAWINNVGQIQGSVAPRDGRSAVRIVSNDAGGVALATGLLKNGVGGSLDLTLLPAGDGGTFDGTLAIRNLRIKDAPAMAALLDAISVVGLLQQLDGQGIGFDAVDAQFRLTPERVILRESSAVGPGLGISLDGIYLLATKQMDFQGVISPFYLINSIGSIFTRRGEGLIGFNFNIAGTTSAPQVSVNPLSAFTPGMFREIFRRSPPEVTE